MSKKDEALNLALEIALEKEYLLRKTGQSHVIEPVITAIREARAEQLAQQEPVVCSVCQGKGRIYQGCGSWIHCSNCNATGKVYTSPPINKPRVSLTDEQITAGARALCKQMAEACGVDVRDQWQLYADTFKEDAKAVLEAANNAKGNT